MIGRLLSQLGLHSVEQVPVENGGLLAIEDLTLENDLTDIEAIAQQVRQRPSCKRNAAHLGARS
jgi:hypothetical protein